MAAKSKSFFFLEKSVIPAEFVLIKNIIIDTIQQGLCFPQKMFLAFRSLVQSMVKTNESRFPPSPNLKKVTVSFDKLNNTDLLPSDYFINRDLI